MGSHLNTDGEFQSDKYPTCPAGKVPLSVRDASAQDLLWAYAGRREVVDAEFSGDLRQALISAGYQPSDHGDCPVAPTRREPARLIDQLRCLFGRHCSCRPINTARLSHSHDCDVSIAGDVRTVLHEIVADGEGFGWIREATGAERASALARCTVLLARLFPDGAADPEGSGLDATDGPGPTHGVDSMATAAEHLRTTAVELRAAVDELRQMVAGGYVPAVGAVRQIERMLPWTVPGSTTGRSAEYVEGYRDARSRAFTVATELRRATERSDYLTRQLARVCRSAGLTLDESPSESKVGSVADALSFSISRAISLAEIRCGVLPVDLASAVTMLAELAEDGEVAESQRQATRAKPGIKRAKKTKSPSGRRRRTGR